ncbi:hypothetical protein ABZ543_13270 [Streptomyces roseifaciens]
MTICQRLNLGVEVPGAERPRLNLLFPLYGKRRADFTRTAKTAIRLIEKKEMA